jgi:pilus assembly protein FimV
MKKEDLNDVVERLEALDSLAQLFKNLWFGKIKDEIKDEKVKAYLMVFEDAFPGLDNVVSFVTKNAKNLSESQVYQVKEEFEILSQSLLNREIAMDLDLEDEIDPGIFEEEGLEEDETSNIPSERIKELAVVDQEAIDDIFTDTETDDLEDLLSDESDTETDDLEDLLSDEVDDEDEFDIDELLDADDEDVEGGETADISDEEMAALLDEDEPVVKKKAAPKAKKKVSEVEEEEGEMDQVSQDEIDALFG